MDTCPHCGGNIEGDGNTITFHCENVDLPADVEPDAPTLLCDAARQLKIGEQVKPGDFFIRKDGSTAVISKSAINTVREASGKPVIINRGSLTTYRKITS